MISPGVAWESMASLYALPGVTDQALSLQDQAGVSVSALLTLVVSASRGHGALCPAAAVAVAESSEAFEADVLRSLRRARNGLKRWFGGPRGEQAQMLRQSLLERELAAEGLEQMLILDMLSEPGVLAPPDDPLADTCRSVARYLTALGVSPSVFQQQSLAHILSAALEDYDGLHLARVLDAALQESRQAMGHG